MALNSITPLRQELEDAIGKVRRQIAMETSPKGADALGPTQQQHLLDELGSELERLEEALAGMGQSDT